MSDIEFWVACYGHDPDLHAEFGGYVCLHACRVPHAEFVLQVATPRIFTVMLHIRQQRGATLISIAVVLQNVHNFPRTAFRLQHQLLFGWTSLNLSALFRGQGSVPLIKSQLSQLGSA